MEIKYTKLKNYKYELAEDLVVQTHITGFSIKHAFFELTPKGVLTVNKGYKWDGVSGPMIDTDNSMIGGCVHDCLYQMIRMKVLPVEVKGMADKELEDKFEACKMSPFRCAYSFLAVDKFGASSCIPGDTHIPPVITLKC